jgi:hypothetical protein
MLIEYTSAEISSREIDGIGDIYDVGRSDDGTVCLALNNSIVRIDGDGKEYMKIDTAGLHPFQFLECADEVIVYSAVDRIELSHWSFWSKQDALSDSNNFWDGVTGIHVRTDSGECVLSYGDYLPLFYSKEKQMLALLARGKFLLEETCGLSVRVNHADNVKDNGFQLVDCSVTYCANDRKAVCSYNDESLNSHWFVWDNGLVFLDISNGYDAYGKDWIFCDEKVLIYDSIYKYDRKGQVDLIKKVDGRRLALDANDELVSWRSDGIYYEKNSHRIISW